MRAASASRSTSPDKEGTARHRLPLQPGGPVSVFYWGRRQLRVRAFRGDKKDNSSRSQTSSTSTQSVTPSRRRAAFAVWPSRPLRDPLLKRARSRGRYGCDVEGQTATAGARHHRDPSGGARLPAPKESHRQAPHQAANVVIMIGRNGSCRSVNGLAAGLPSCAAPRSRSRSS